VLIAPYVLAVYGLGWTVASAMAGKRWLFWVGMASFAAAVALGFLANTENLYLGYAAALVLLVSLPGYLLLRQEPAAIV
jgi:Na+/melibiose symporter-like transporter